MLDRTRKAELVQRMLGIKHKIKVHESMSKPETHEDLAVSLLAQWELEDELHAIEALLAKDRGENVVAKRKLIESGVLTVKKRG